MAGRGAALAYYLLNYVTTAATVGAIASATAAVATTGELRLVSIGAAVVLALTATACAVARKVAELA